MQPAASAAVQQPPEVALLACTEEGSQCEERRVSATLGEICFRKRIGRAASLVVLGLALAAVFAVGVSHGTAREIGPTDEIEQKADAKVCSKQWDNCMETKCCTVPGTTCYEKDGNYSACRPECVSGPDPVDVNNKSWSCKKLGPKKPGAFHGDWGKVGPWVAMQCAGAGESCMDSGCCTQPGFQCFKKNEEWASCKILCTPGADPTDPNETSHTWDCKALGFRTPGAADYTGYKAAKWVGEKCSAEGDNCADTGCCKAAGLQCFRKNGEHAECLRSCHPGKRVTDAEPGDWNCSAVGARTPGRIPAIGNIWEKVSKNKWVKKTCAWSPSKFNKYKGDNCMKSKCCAEDGFQCYSMNKDYGQCLKTCSTYVKFAPNKPLMTKDGKPWECKKYGQRHPRKWGWPSLFCFSVFRIYTYEGDIIKNQLSKGLGIFGCEEASLLSQDAEVVVGDGPPDGETSTVHFDFVPVGVSTDGTAGNTGLFLNVWESVRWSGKYNLCDWTVKADPDAVLLPDKMRYHISPPRAHQGTLLYNCPKFPDSPLYGAIEAVSKKALQNYFNNEGNCRSMPWGGWGEDKWFAKCIPSVGGQPQMDAGLVGDALCLGQNCADGKPAYHPLKNVGAWMNCWYQAGR
jgi:hypothetical protein